MNDHVDDNVACPRSRGFPIDDFDEDYFALLVPTTTIKMTK